MREEIVLDVIPISIGKKYPTKEEIFHYKYIKGEGEEEEYVMRTIMSEIEISFERNTEYEHGIILYEGKVIKMF